MKKRGEGSSNVTETYDIASVVIRVRPPAAVPNKMRKCTYCGTEDHACSCKSLRRRRRLYGLPEIEYEELVRKQKKLCAICGTKPSVLVVDHDHTTGRIRGLLCNECNLGLGKFRDSYEILFRAANYLNPDVV